MRGPGCCDIKVENALAVEVDEHEAVVVVVVDAHTEAGGLVERHRRAEIGHRKRRRRGHPDSAEQPFETVPTQLDVVA